MSAKNSKTVDLARYCARIGYAGPLEPTSATLAGLIEHHIAKIPFENIDILLERGIDLSPAAVDAKLIGRGRGGYCFEQNGLFKRVLGAIGFHVESLAARVLWMAPTNAPPHPRTHMALRVTLDGAPWLADVGFGGGGPTSPLSLAETAPQATRHEPFRVVPRGAGVIVEAEFDGTWHALYDLSLEPLLDVDHVPSNWYTSTHPASPFRRALMVARATDDTRYALLNRRLTVRRQSGPVERRNLDAGELERTLTDTFGLPVEPEWRPLLQRIAAPAG